MPESRGQAEHHQTPESVVDNFLLAAQTLIELGDLTQAELRLRAALKQADLTLAPNSSVVRRALETLAHFYRTNNRNEALEPLEKRLNMIKAVGESPEQEKNKKLADSSYGRLLSLARKGDRPQEKQRISQTRVPQEIRRSCQILGLPIDELDDKTVRQAWKRAVTDPTAHPDLGGEHEVAIQLNTARDTILSWLAEQQPKLLKKFERIVRNNS